MKLEIVIELWNMMLDDVKGLPKGWSYFLNDLDVDDDEEQEKFSIKKYPKSMYIEIEGGDIQKIRNAPKGYRVIVHDVMEGNGYDEDNTYTYLENPQRKRNGGKVPIPSMDDPFGRGELPVKTSTDTSATKAEVKKAKKRKKLQSLKNKESKLEAWIARSTSKREKMKLREELRKVKVEQLRHKRAIIAAKPNPQPRKMKGVIAKLDRWDDKSTLMERKYSFRPYGDWWMTEARDFYWGMNIDPHEILETYGEKFLERLHNGEIIEIELDYDKKLFEYRGKSKYGNKYKIGTSRYIYPYEGMAESLDIDLTEYRKKKSKPNPGWDSSKNQWRFRLMDPEDFEKGSFRTITVKPGLMLIVGVKKGKKVSAVQALRFDKDQFTLAQAKNWKETTWNRRRNPNFRVHDAKTFLIEADALEYIVQQHLQPHQYKMTFCMELDKWIVERM